MSQQKTRIDALAQQKKASRGSRTFRILWKGKHEDFPVVQVRTTDLCYRIDNGRTRRAQSRYLAENPSLPRDFFNDPEDKRVQSAQHDILKAMIDEKELKEFLELEGQADPAIITPDGYVLNGNRRLCALRELGVEYMDVVMLPPCDRQDLYDLELTLQMAPETKAEYNWVDELLQVREGLEVYQESAAQIARRMRTTPEQVMQLRRRLALIDDYLRYVGAEGQYHRVEEDTKQHFIDLQDHLDSPAEKRMTPEQLRFFRELCYVLIQQREFYRDIRKEWGEFRKDPDGFIRGFRSNAREEVAATQSAWEQVSTVNGNEPLGLNPTSAAKANGADLIQTTLPLLVPGVMAAPPQGSTDGSQSNPVRFQENDLMEAIVEAAAPDAESTSPETAMGGLDIIRRLAVTDPKIVSRAALVTKEDLLTKRQQQELSAKPAEALRSVHRTLEAIDLRAAAEASPEHFNLEDILQLLTKVETDLAALRVAATSLST